MSVLRDRISALEPAFLDAVVHVYEVVENEEKGKSERRQRIEELEQKIADLQLYQNQNLQKQLEEKTSAWQQQVRVLKEKLSELQEKAGHGGGGSNNKFAAFAQDTDGLIQAQFGDINLFMHMGLVGLIGRPSPDIFRAM